MTDSSVQISEKIMDYESPFVPLSQKGTKGTKKAAVLGLLLHRFLKKLVVTA